MSRTGDGQLLREVGLGGAVLLGLGSIVGTGLFVSLGLATGVAGQGVFLALPLAAFLALCNGLSSAQLAAAHPVSGGTYEYGYRFLGPELGFTAGWVFLLAKSASAATAALGFGGYLFTLFGRTPSEGMRTASAVGLVLTLTVLVLGGIRRSNRANAAIVSVTLLVLTAFVVAGAPDGWAALRDGLGLAAPDGAATDDASGGTGLRSVAHASALLFVAYTGYGRVATLGEEVTRPSRTIPRAIALTLGITTVLYLAVAAVGVGVLGTAGFAGATETSAAPLAIAAEALAVPGLAPAVEVAAVTAMVGVLLNLVLGLSRVALAMARRGDLPRVLARVDADSGSPRPAVLAIGAVVALLALVGNVETTWSFSAFTVLLYYGITNLAALRLPAELRRYPRLVALTGLAGCLLLAFQVETVIWGIGSSLVLIAIGARLLRSSEG